jgi:hypothetical protein
VPEELSPCKTGHIIFAATTRHNYTSGVKLARWHMWHTFERWVCWCTFTSGLFFVIHICPCLFPVNKLKSLSRRLQTASSLWISIMWRAKIWLALQNGKKSKDLYFQQLKYWNWICSYSVLEVHYFVIILHSNTVSMSAHYTTVDQKRIFLWMASVCGDTCGWQ